LSQVNEAELAHSPEELRMIVTASHAHGVLNATETRLLENVFGLSERPVAEIMTPRVEMICLDRSRSFEDNLQIVRTEQHTRYPLIDGNPDQVLGIIHVKDLIRIAGEENVSLDAVMRPVNFIPESASIDHLLKLIQKTRSLMAVVVEEYGGVAGLVTLEDILEELIGPIRDEFDAGELPDVVRRGREVHLSPGVSLNDVVQLLPGLAFKPDEDVRTIGGQIMKHLGRIPRTGDEVLLGAWKARITRMEGQRVTRLAMIPVEPTE
jgi:CBS domain containing-hemolysin-like protein